MKEYLELRTGQRMPAVGLGTGKLGLTEPDSANEFEKVIESALVLGYRHFDTATRYGSEHLLGHSLQKWIGSKGCRREELFIVSKLPINGMRKELVSQFLNSSLEKLQMDYVDLYLIHWPIGLAFISEDEFTPRAMESMVDCGKARAIGISNFNEGQLDRIIKSCRIPPSCLQIEVHAYFQQKSLKEFCYRNDIQICAYAPLASPFRRDYPNASELNIPSLLDDKVVKEIANFHEKTAAQILLRYLVQGLAVAVIPKSCNDKRLAENFKIFDFELTSTDIERLQELDRGENGRTWHSFEGASEHPECPF